MSAPPGAAFNPLTRVVLPLTSPGSHHQGPNGTYFVGPSAHASTPKVPVKGSFRPCLGPPFGPGLVAPRIGPPLAPLARVLAPALAWAGPVGREQPATTARTLPVMLRTVAATRYVTPFREGGSLPGLCEADDDGLYVVKFHGAGQGPKALVAEVIVGELARALGLPVPEQVLVELDARLAAGEPHWEVKELLDRSPGTNLGVDFLPGALGFAPAVGPAPDPDLAAAFVWLDAFTLNVDRTPATRISWSGTAGSTGSTTVRPSTCSTAGRTPCATPATPGGRSPRSAITSCCRSPGRSSKRTPGWRRR